MSSDSFSHNDHPTLLTSKPHALNPPSLNVKSFRSGRTSNLDGSMDSMLQPSAATWDSLGNPNCDVTISSISTSGTGSFINHAGKK